MARDPRSRDELLRLGRRVAEVWECPLKGRERQPLEALLQRLTEFLRSNERHCVIGNDQTVCVAANDIASRDHQAIRSRMRLSATRRW